MKVVVNLVGLVVGVEIYGGVGLLGEDVYVRL